MRYMLLLYDNEKDWVNMSEAEQGNVFGEYGAFTESVTKSGNYVSGEPLEPTTTATTVRGARGSAETPRSLHARGRFVPCGNQHDHVGAGAAVSGEAVESRKSRALELSPCGH